MPKICQVALFHMVIIVGHNFFLCPNNLELPLCHKGQKVGISLHHMPLVPKRLFWVFVVKNKKNGSSFNRKNGGVLKFIHLTFNIGRSN